MLDKCLLFKFLQITIEKYVACFHPQRINFYFRQKSSEGTIGTIF